MLGASGVLNRSLLRRQIRARVLVAVQLASGERHTNRNLRVQRIRSCYMAYGLSLAFEIQYPFYTDSTAIRDSKDEFKMEAWNNGIAELRKV